MAGEGQPKFSRRRFLQGAAVGLGVTATDLGLLGSLAHASAGTVVAENARPGADLSGWNYDGSQMDTTIEGFAGEFSVNAGQTVRFKVKTDAADWQIRVYRLGWYGGAGAHLATTLTPTAGAGIQPSPLGDPSTGLVDCGNWSDSATWAVPADTVSGVHMAIFQRNDTGGVNRAWFVVRNDGRTSDLLVQTSDTTWQAYNRWGGGSLYLNPAAPYGRNSKVSYNRPLLPPGPEYTFLWAEFPLVRWLERNGYDVAYCAGVDTDRRPAELLSRKVFVSSGHDEYWSSQQRASVEAARDAGVNLVFMSGNEVFWKTRWEPGLDPSATPYKTLVCYKETQNNAKIDPSGAWTGTWRDARFSPPADGGRPENALTGTLFKAINPNGAVDFAIRVPYEYSRLRIWRNTSIAGLTAGQVATLSASTLGYEWDVDADNGVRPAGLIRMSETTEVADQVLQNEGTQYLSQAATHSLTMYRAASGALVWGLGTVQWAWGLDPFHNTDPEGTIPADPRIQQATLNVLADLGVQPTTRQTDLVAAAQSTDTTPPSVVIGIPAPGSTVPIGSPVTIAGTAADQDGQVAAVEVSTDGGSSWHPATGTSSWSYTYTPLLLGPISIRARAVDDSCNVTPSPAALALTGGPRSYPCSVWPVATLPKVADSGDAGAIEVGLRFRATVNGYATGIRYYKAPGATGTHVGHLWSASGTLLGSATFSGETASGWQQAALSAPVPLVAGTTYVASTFMPNGHYAVDPAYFASAYDLPPLRALADGEDGPNGVFRAGSSGFPVSTYGKNNYWVDLVFDNDDHRTPAVVDRSPAPDVQAVATGAVMSATFSEFMSTAGLAFTLTDPVGNPIQGTTTYDEPTRTATFTPSAPLAALSTYAVTVAGSDLSGTASAPVSWSFTTTGAPGTYPATLWDSSAVPAVPSVTDTNEVELGVRFTSDVDGLASALRFYKAAGNDGPHVGRLWDAAGTLLATVTFGAESGSGWQQAPFAQPVALARNAVYVASYHSPGRYSVTSGDLANGRSRGALHAVAATLGGNGVYRYGPAGFPNQASGGTNYWVDVVMMPVPDTVAPTVVDRSPAPDVNAVALDATVAAVFDEPVVPATIVFGLSSPAGPVAGAISYDAPTRTARFTPAGLLTPGTTYTAALSGARDPAGNPMSAMTWNFTASAGAGSYPATLWDSAAVPAVAASSDTGAIEVGVRFRSDVAGLVTAIRFFKGPGNAGTHVGHLWDASGALLGSVTFAGETATGWQQAALPSPVAVSAGAVYTASYHCDNGHYSASAAGLAGGRDTGALHALADVQGGNGVYRYGAAAMPASSYNGTNYWVDVVMTAIPDTVAPTIVDRTPAPGINALPLDTTATATFDESVDPASVVFTLTGPGGTVAGTTAYDAPGHTSRFTPGAPLVAGTTYTASVSGATDPAGNTMAGAVTWTFTTASTPGSYPATLWDGAAVPAAAAVNDGGSIEVGLRFTADAAAHVSAVRFYKGPGNTGTHVGHLWDAAGTLLGSVTFTLETATGWQQAAFASPIPIAAGAVYTVSYHCDNGHYAATSGDLVAGRDRAPLHAVPNNQGGNGVYVYGPAALPTNNWNATNYWVDVVVIP